MILVVRAGFLLAEASLTAGAEVANLETDPLGAASGAIWNPCGTVALGLSAEEGSGAAVIGVGSELVVLMEDGDLAVDGDEGLAAVVVVVVVVSGAGLGCRRSTWPRSRVGSMMLRTSCLRCLTSVSGIMS